MITLEKGANNMPPYNTHLETCTKRAGKDYQTMHDWLDNYPQIKAQRHSLNNLPEIISFVRSSWGTIRIPSP
jgi:hypothetical protein